MSQTQNTIQQIEAILPELKLSQLKMVLAFAEFVHERLASQDEDAKLWSFVEREQAYRTDHPKDVRVFSTDEDLLAVLEEM